MKGLVIKTTGSWYTVKTDDGRLFECKVKGTFRLKGIRSTNPVAVGDVVSITPGADGQTALIEDIEDRRNYIIRKASNLSKQSHIIAANVIPRRARPSSTASWQARRRIVYLS